MALWEQKVIVDQIYYAMNVQKLQKVSPFKSWPQYNFLTQISLEAIPLLIGVIQAADSKAKENVNATENCISAVGKVMKYRPECVNVDEILPHWISWLPLNEDKEEAVHTFNYLCDLIERWVTWSYMLGGIQIKKFYFYILIFHCFVLLF